MKLTAVAIRAAKPRNKAYKLFDGGGLYLEVSPAGGVVNLSSAASLEVPDVVWSAVTDRNI